MYNPDIHNRCSIRLENHDYSTGRYYVTIATHARLPLFGRIVDGCMLKNDAGLMIEDTWISIILRFLNVILDSYVVMPEHIHGIIDLGDNNNQTYELCDIIGYYKSQATLNYIKGVRENHWHGFEKKLWQRNYFERYIRDDLELISIKQYIINNPADFQRTMYEDF